MKINVSRVILKDDFKTPEKWETDKDMTLAHVLKLILNTPTKNDADAIKDFRALVTQSDLIQKLALTEGELEISERERNLIKDRLYVLSMVSNGVHWIIQVVDELKLED